jgi:hypothetical protein
MAFRPRPLLIGAAIAAPIALALPGLAQQYVPPIPSIDELPEGVGREEVFYTCTACHSLDVVKAQHKDEVGWNEIVDYMITVQGLFPPTPEDRAKIVSYLATNFPALAAPAYVNPFLR